jgi:hypothetical protein
MDIDKLRELAADPRNKAKDIRDALGFNNDAALHYELNKDPEAKKIYSERASKSGGGGDDGGKASARKPRQTSARARKSLPPPNNRRATNGNGRISDELLRKVKVEVELIALYGEKSDHFDEIADELRAV